MPATVEPGPDRLARRRTAGSWLYLLPAALLLTGVFAVPLAESFVLSLQKDAGMAGTAGWAGLHNYAGELSSGVFWQVAWQTALWTVGVVGLTLVVSFVLASLLRSPFRGRTACRTLLMIPWASSIAVSAVVWQFGFAPNGLIDRTLQLFGLSSLIEPWLANTPQSMVVLILVGVWVSVPFSTVMILAGMSGIPHELYDAAALESSRALHSERYITLPLLRHVLLIATMSNFVVVFNSFPIIYVMTGGGPINRTNILATYLYQEAFQDLEFGHASAVAVLVSVFLLSVTFVYVRVLVHPRRRYERVAKVG